LYKYYYYASLAAGGHKNLFGIKSAKFKQ